MTDAIHYDSAPYGTARYDTARHGTAPYGAARGAARGATRAHDSRGYDTRAEHEDDVLATMERQFDSQLARRPAHALHVLSQSGHEFTPTTARQLDEAPAELIDPLGRWIDPTDAAVLRGEVVLVIGWHSLTGEPVRGRAAADSDTGRDWSRVRRVFLRGA